jgi:hypothetical protein
MKFKEIWEYNTEGKLFIIWIPILCIFLIVDILITDFATKVMLTIFGYATILVPFWLFGIFYLKKKRKDLKSKYKWKHGLFFEFAFFLFLFCSQYFLAFFLYYVGIKEFWQMIYAGIGVMFFTINAIFAGICHYIYKFDV